MQLSIRGHHQFDLPGQILRVRFRPGFLSEGVLYCTAVKLYSCTRKYRFSYSFVLSMLQHASQVTPATNAPSALVSGKHWPVNRNRSELAVRIEHSRASPLHLCEKLSARNLDGSMCAWSPQPGRGVKRQVGCCGQRSGRLVLIRCLADPVLSHRCVGRTLACTQSLCMGLLTLRFPT